MGREVHVVEFVLCEEGLHFEYHFGENLEHVFELVFLEGAILYHRANT